MQLVTALAKRTILTVFSAVSAVVCLTGTARAQTVISGVVTDQHGARLSGAQVTVSNEASSFSRVVSTDRDGTYRVSDLGSLRYVVSVSSRGFAPATRGVEPGAGTVVLDFQLGLASAASSVTVQANKNVYGEIAPPDLVDLGPQGFQRPLDSPYQADEVSQEIIRSQNIRDAANFLAYDPSTQMSRGANFGRPFTRGFESGVVENTRIDGLNIIITTGYPAEQFDRLEILQSVAGSLYGPANPTGTFNYVLKRPQAHPRQTIGYGYDENGISTVYADLGASVRKVDSRLNVVYGNGKSYTSTSNYRRFLASGSVDLHFTPRSVLQLNASYYYWRALGLPATIAYGSGQSTQLPDALDASRTGYGVKGAGNQNYTNTFSGRFLHSFGGDWQLTAGLLNQAVERGLFQPTFTLNDNAGDYTASIPKSGASRFTIVSNNVYLNGTLRGSHLTHAIFLGTNGFTWNTFSASGANVSLGKGNLANPTLFDPQTRPVGQPAQVTSNIFQQALVAGDSISFDKHWVLSLNSSFSWLTETNYSATKVITGQNAVHGYWSPTASLMYKPTPRQSGYVSFSESIMQGDTAPTTVVNSGETLAPYRSRQYEAGYKFALTDKLLLTAAGFRINKPFAATDAQNIYRAEGVQVNWGSTVSVTGQLTHDLSVTGGFQELVPTLTNTGVVSTEGKDVVGVARWQDNALFEYKVPRVKGLEVSDNLHYTGRRAANDTNTTFAQGYFVMDLAGGYLLPVRGDGHALSLRASVQNVTNKRYWQSIYPTSGTSLAGSSAFPGTPRIFSLSVDYEF